MSGLDSIRSQLTEDALAVINAIWEYDLEKEKCIPTTALFVRVGPDVATSGLKSLNGSIVIEHSGDGTKRCCLTFLGRLMARDGALGEELLKRLLKFIQSRLLADPEFTTVDSESVGEALALTDAEFRTLSHYYWQSPFTGGGGGQKSRWSFGVPYYMHNDLPLEKDLDAYVRRYALRDFDAKLPVLYDERSKYQSRQRGPTVSARVFYSWQSDLPNATNRGFIEKALEDAAKSIREDGSIFVEPVVDRDTAGVPGSPDIASTILEKIERADVFVCDISIITQGVSRLTPNPNVLIELGYALKVLGAERIIMVLNSVYGGPELLPFDLRMRRVIPYEMEEKNQERGPERRKLQSILAEGMRTIFGGSMDRMPGEVIQPEAPKQKVSVASFATSTFKEFDDYITSLLAQNNENELNIIIEKLRDLTVSVWNLGPYGRQAVIESIASIRRDPFLPALSKLVSLGLLLIKFNGPVGWFTKVADLLVEIFSVSNSLMFTIPEEFRRSQGKTINEVLNHSVPALESLVAAYLLGAYELGNKKSVKYTSSFFPRLVDWVGSSPSVSKKFYLFWPINSGIWLPYRHLFVADRYGDDEAVTTIVGGKEVIGRAVLQLDCLVDWHSFMGNASKEVETLKFFKGTFPNVSTNFIPSFTHEDLSLVGDFMHRLWQSIQDGSENYYSLDNQLSKVIEGLTPTRRRHLFARFAIYAEGKRNEMLWQSQQLPWPHYWPPEIQQAIDEVRDLEAQSAAAAGS